MYVSRLHNGARLSPSAFDLSSIFFSLPLLPVSGPLHFYSQHSFRRSNPRQAGWQLVLNYETSLGAVTRDAERKGDPREREPLKDMSRTHVWVHVAHAHVQPNAPKCTFAKQSMKGVVDDRYTPVCIEGSSSTFLIDE